MPQSQNQYVIVRELGHGSFGKVYKVKKGKVEFAMKVINNIDQYAIQEVQILKNANHPNIIKYVECFLENSSLKIVMEFADQGTLTTQHLNWSEEKIWEFLAQMGNAFAYLHGQGIIHRDLKPENILCVSVGNSGNMFKVADFGIAKLVDNATQSNHYANTYAGTYCYMVPEVLNRQRYTFSADMWSLGAVLSFVCNKGKHLFRSNNEVRQLRGMKDPLPKHFSSSLRGVAIKLLSINPKERPSASAIYEKAKKKYQTNNGMFFVLAAVAAIVLIPVAFVIATLNE